MATEATEQLNEIISRIDAADHQIDEARGQIHTICGSFEALFAHNPWDEDLLLPDLDHEISEMGQAIQHATGDVTARVDATLDAGIALLTQTGDELQQLTAGWETSKQQAVQSCEEFEHALQESLQRIESGFDDLGQRLTTSAQALDTASTALDKVYADWEQATSGEFSRLLEERFRTMVQQLGDAEMHKIEQQLSDAQHQTGEAFEQLLTTGSQLINDLSHTLGEVIDQLQQHVSSEVANKLHEAANTLIETAIREILQSIMESIATSELGVVLTAEMSPVLPELIAAKKLTDAILAAIRLWKDSIGRLTDPFDMF